MGFCIDLHTVNKHTIQYLKVPQFLNLILKVSEKNESSIVRIAKSRKRIIAQEEFQLPDKTFKDARTSFIFVLRIF